MTIDCILTKHHGLGNDFLVALDPPAAFADGDLSALARRLCDRRVGIGADGLLIGFAAEADGYAARMVLHNADGSRAEMSGNGIRCFAQALARRVGSLEPLLITTDAGDRLVTFGAGDGPHTVAASVDMGEVGERSEPEGWHLLGAHPDRPVAHLDVGNPHSVVGVDDVNEVDLSALGSHVPGVNLEIVHPGPDVDSITMRVHERGVGVTAACGTGAVAAATAAHRWGLVGVGTKEIHVHMDGGSATVAVDEPSPGRATLTGPATYIATIEVPIA